MRSSPVASSDAPSQSNPGNTFQARPFVGRDEETAQLVALLRRLDVRLITLTGPGGVGKTRLAMRVAELVESEFESGTLFITLASLDDPTLVAPAIGQVFGLGDYGDQRLANRIASVMAGRSKLLLVDNFEHVVEAAPFLAELINACPSAKLLVTSRRRLHLSLELEFAVKPFPPVITTATPSQISASPAVRLFRNHARHHLAEIGSVEETSSEASCIAEICARLDGLPLAIELAAAQTRIMSPCELLGRLEQRLPMLDDSPRDAPQRQRSMRDTIAWSYDLLSPDAQILFRALSVFQGGFTLAAVEGIFPDLPDSPELPHVKELIDGSLIQRSASASGFPRFSILETVREFGLEMLKASGEEQSRRKRLLAWFVEHLEDQPTKAMFGLQATPRFDFPDDQDNLRTALNLAIDRSLAEEAAHIAYALMPYWRTHGLNSEAALTFERMLAISESLDQQTVAELNFWAAWFAYQTGDLPATTSRVWTALGLFRSFGLEEGILESLIILGMVTRWSDAPASVEYFTEVIERSILLDDTRTNALVQRGISRIVNGELRLAELDLNDALHVSAALPDHSHSRSMELAVLAWVTGHLQDAGAAEQLARESLSINQNKQNRVAWNFAHRVLGEAAMTRGDLQRAAIYLTDGLELAHQMGIPQIESWNLAQLAAVSNLKGDWQRAARLYGAAQSLWQRLGFSESTRKMMSSWSGRHVPSQMDLADETFNREMEIGRDLSYADVYAEARAVVFMPAQIEATSPILSPREQQVLRLVGNLRSNREIADLLFVSKRTVDSHVGSIFFKLGVKSRREAVESARRQGLIASEAP